MYTRFLFAVLIAGISLHTARAQEVEFEIPESIDIVPGRLSVAFQDTVHEATARLIVTGFGYQIIESAFEPYRVWASLPDRLAPDQVDRLEADPRVISLSQTPLPEQGIAASDEATGIERPKYTLAIVFESHVGPGQAAGLLEDIAGVAISRTEKRPNELVIEVGDQDAEAFDALDGIEGVKWVTYVGEAVNE